MNKSDLIEKMSKTYNLPKKAASDYVDFVLKTVIEGLEEDNKMVLSGFGTFTLKTWKERKGRNPRTGEEIDIPSRKTMKFLPSNVLRDSLNMGSGDTTKEESAPETEPSSD